jgi:hypothetical protein
MSERHFIVYQRDSSWQFSFRGSITAPFRTREAAIEAAIEEARQSGDAEVEVLVQDANMQTQSVWRPEAG